MPEFAVSRILRAGVTLGLLFMLSGALFTLFGVYDDHLILSVRYLFTNGAGLLYLGTFTMLATPLFVLLYLSLYFIAVKRARYAVYCLMIVGFLVFVVFTRL